MRYNLKYAPNVYRLIGAALIGNFFDAPLLIIKSKFLRNVQYTLRWDSKTEIYIYIYIYIYICNSYKNTIERTIDLREYLAIFICDVLWPSIPSSQLSFLYSSSIPSSQLSFLSYFYSDCTPPRVLIIY